MNRFRMAAGACLLLGTAGAAGAQEPGATYQLGGFTASVSADGEACRLTLDRDALKAAFILPLPVPCALHTGVDGKPRTMSRGDDLFFLVEASRPLAEGSADCDTRIQAVRLDRYGADLAPQVERVAACLPMDWDDAVFLSMFPVP